MRSDRARIPARFSRRRFLGAAGLPMLLPSLLQAAAPLRLVSLDYGLAATAISLGLPPLAIADRGGWQMWVRAPELPATTADLGLASEVNLEVLAALSPDLILTTPYLGGQLPRLSRYGRVLEIDSFQSDGRPMLETVRRATRELAEALERPVEAERLIASAEAEFDAIAARLAALAPPPLVLGHFMDSRHLRLFTANGLFGDVLQRIGLENAWREPGNLWGFQSVSLDRLASIEDPRTRLVLFEPLPADLDAALGRSPLWQGLGFAEPGRILRLPPVLAFGMLDAGLRLAHLLAEALEAGA